MWQCWTELIFGTAVVVIAITLILAVAVVSYNTTRFFVENNYCYETLIGQNGAVWVKCDVKAAQPKKETK